MLRFNTQVVLTLILILANSLLLISQSDTSWYRHYVMDTLDIMFPSSLETCGNDAVLVISAVAPISDPPYNRSAILRIDDESGDILWITRLIHNPVAEDSQIFFYFRGIIRLRDGSFILLVDTMTEEGKSGFVLYRISGDGSLVWRQDYGIPNQDIIANTGGLAIGPDSMSFAVSARRIDIENPSSNLMLYHIDSEGEVINHLNLSTGLQFYWAVSPLAMLTDSSFVVGFNLGIINLSAPKWLSLVSYSGQFLNTHVAWDFGWWSDLKRHSNGQIVAVSQSFSGEWENREKHGLRTTMYSPNLDTIWSRIYNHFAGPLYYIETDFPGGASFDPKGNILVTGDGAALGGVRAAHLITYNADGVAQWTKRLGIGEDVAGYVQSIGGEIAFQPNGILLAGPISVNEMLLVRLDSSGCIFETDCGADYLLNVDYEQDEPVLDFWLTPNPAIDQVMISLTNDYFQLLKTPKTHILDLTGRILASTTLLGPRQHMDINNLPMGIYIVMLESRGRAAKVQKLIKR